MGTSAETAMVDYCLSLTDQGKQTSVFRFRLHQTNRILLFCFLFAANKQKLPFVYMYVHIYIYKSALRAATAQ
jgi:hypothetical protein